MNSLFMSLLACSARLRMFDRVLQDSENFTPPPPKRISRRSMVKLTNQKVPRRK